ncbi:hypothetical protein [Paenibacillus hunanensis]|uniref:DUF3918 domain-containing protein n=1 Tax=Paenibacillus hunanensis TaxID=539262 RepID=A0ABU1J007_9BACL|nr:hypothetical protein [Paenibacillus hunanensis]MCL9661524.1 hypothetical protein [Paenibacillus hunanensis]MDR6244829.1 hypothetical protein [Paenibacillus hunanensis]WPP41639.1 hypothetical protein SK066_01360 [Paenibacillus hunanensis]GGJ04429.1 hypothetical protein GCM10008022_11810 [Paenibacillus hunanensis]
MTGRKALWTTIGLGAVYLMRNKNARDKVMTQVRNISSSLRQRKSEAPGTTTGTTMNSTLR